LPSNIPLSRFLALSSFLRERKGLRIDGREKEEGGEERGLGSVAPESPSGFAAAAATERQQRRRLRRRIGVDDSLAAIATGLEIALPLLRLHSERIKN